jgi:hypothetical protein
MLTKLDLDEFLAKPCGDPGCTSDNHTEVYLHCRHHLESPTWAKYHLGGWLEVVCAECDRSIAVKDPRLKPWASREHETDDANAS